jgi:hypothetical protein
VQAEVRGCHPGDHDGDAEPEEVVLRSLASGQQQPISVPLANGGQIVIRCEPVLDGIRLVGVLIRPITATTRTHGTRPRRNTATTSGYGWSSLTDTEVAVAQQVAQGTATLNQPAR